jgi:endonuclease YncB( thermonuclease family)
MPRFTRGRERALGAAAGIALALVLVSVLSSGGSLVGKATVVDGDTLRMGADRVRLVGIDAPELAQTCLDAAGTEWRCGSAARDQLRRLVGSVDLACALHGRDRFDRVLASCEQGGNDLGRAMVEAGLAVADGQYLAEEAEARAARRGIWGGTFEAPAAWRAEHREGQAASNIWPLLQGWFR